MKIDRISIIVIVCVAVQVEKVVSMDMKLPYFADVTLSCDSNLENDTLTRSGELKKEHFIWLLPNGQVLSEEQHQYDRSRIHMIFENQTSFLRIKKIDDDDFGIYWCVCLQNGSVIQAIRHTLNIDGALMDHYVEQQIKNVVVGSISGGVVLLVILICYTIWHFRFSNKAMRRRKLEEHIQKGVNKYDTKFYDNVGLEMYTKKKDANSHHHV